MNSNQLGLADLLTCTSPVLRAPPPPSGLGGGLEAAGRAAGAVTPGAWELALNPSQLKARPSVDPSVMITASGSGGRRRPLGLPARP